MIRPTYLVLAMVAALAAFLYEQTFVPFLSNRYWVLPLVMFPSLALAVALMTFRSTRGSALRAIAVGRASALALEIVAAFWLGAGLAVGGY